MDNRVFSPRLLLCCVCKGGTLQGGVALSGCYGTAPPHPIHSLQSIYQSKTARCKQTHQHTDTSFKRVIQNNFLSKGLCDCERVGVLCNGVSSDLNGKNTLTACECLFNVMALDREYLSHILSSRCMAQVKWNILFIFKSRYLNSDGRPFSCVV